MTKSSTNQTTDYQYWSATVAFYREIEGPKGGMKLKTVKERYLVWAVSPTDVEVRITELCKDSVDEWELKSVTTTSYVQVLMPGPGTK